MGSQAVYCFRDYVTLKLHFNTPAVNWHSDMGKKISAEALYKRKDSVFFERMAYKMKSREDRQQYMISAFYRNQDTWIGEMMDPEIKDFHRRRMIRVGSISHTFHSEVENIIEYMDEQSTNIKGLLQGKDEQAPMIIQNRQDIIGGVSDETLGLLDKAFNFTSQPTSDPLWKQQSFKLSKYKTFLEIDRDYLLHHLNMLANKDTNGNHS